jgi:hypothetical protein
VRFRTTQSITDAPKTSLALLSTRERINLRRSRTEHLQRILLKYPADVGIALERALESRPFCQEIVKQSSALAVDLVLRRGLQGNFIDRVWHFLKRQSVQWSEAFPSGLPYAANIGGLFFAAAQRSMRRRKRSASIELRPGQS